MDIGEDKMAVKGDEGGVGGHETGFWEQKLGFGVQEMGFGTEEMGFGVEEMRFWVEKSGFWEGEIGGVWVSGGDKMAAGGDKMAEMASSCGGVPSPPSASSSGSPRLGGSLVLLGELGTLGEGLGGSSSLAAILVLRSSSGTTPGGRC